MLISEFGPVLWLIKVYGGEKLFTQRCAPKKAHGPLEHPGKLREGDGQFSKKWSKLACPLTSLNLAFSSELQVHE